MSGKRLTPEEVERARELYRHGESFRAIADAVGASHPSIRSRARREGWERAEGEEEARREERRRRTEAAQLAAARKWANRRETEADNAGIVAARARQAILTALDEKDEKMTKASAIAYGILIDKAQLLSGAATARVDGIDPKERALGVLDELARKRAERAS